MEKTDEKLIYRIMAQTDTLTVSAETSIEVTADEVAEIASKDVLLGDGVRYKNFVALPICTKEQWDGGHVNFCPRCGNRLNEYDTDSVETQYNGDCFRCNSTIDVSIEVYEEEE
ncbi:hypothetical protein [Alicyclobacillus dauci]|uniref:Uncharacterized protein n=1 Tax=Alicyclobacillus dauci TaxID=1475485 RepID=A0ABY6YY36_9BACL|nr:hypothetical protein [Alicyclobacillus dauci]WAH35016.1 hypothetical protein NZD86_11820 [Alicyclobacillus dauci]